MKSVKTLSLHQTTSLKKSSKIFKNFQKSSEIFRKADVLSSQQANLSKMMYLSNVFSPRSKRLLVELIEAKILPFDKINSAAAHDLAVKALQILRSQENSSEERDFSSTMKFEASKL